MEINYSRWRKNTDRQTDWVCDSLSSCRSQNCRISSCFSLLSCKWNLHLKLTVLCVWFADSKTFIVVQIWLGGNWSLQRQIITFQSFPEENVWFNLDSIFTKIPISLKTQSTSFMMDFFLKMFGFYSLFSPFHECKI